MITKLITWIVLGAIVGWIVSLILGRDFKGGCLTYVVVGIITWILLGLVLKLFWILLVVSVVVILGAALLNLLQR